MTLSIKVGLRVIPNTKSSLFNEDRNYIGTVTQVDHVSDNYVAVRWDNGQLNTYGIGGSKGHDLLVYDSAQVGIKHDNCMCNGCNSEVFGALWKCLECEYSICTECYATGFDKHHSFYRKDAPDDIGVFVGKRNEQSIEKYYGIISNSFVQTVSNMSKLEHGKVDSFVNREHSYRSMVKVKMGSNIIKNKRLGYNGRVDICLYKNKEETKSDIYANHLRILNLHPIINRDFYNIYREYFKDILFRELEEQFDFQEDDVVYIECFDVEDLKFYQNAFGPSNIKVEKLIGQSGTVKRVELHRVQVFFSKLNESFYFNHKILFNARNSKMKIVKICHMEKLNTEIENWRNCEKFEKLSYKNWMPEQTVLGKICNKIGVIISDTLPDNLVVIRFKLFPHCFCMILPSSVCLNIEQCENDVDLVENISCSLTFENGDVEVGANLIKSEDNAAFLQWLENSVVCENDWCKLMKFAIEMKNINLVEGLLIKHKHGTRRTKDILLWNICCRNYDGNISSTPEIQKMLVDFINPLNISKNIVENNNLLHLSSKNNDADIVELLLNKNSKLVDCQDKNLGYTALHYAAENNFVSVVKILMKNNCDIYVVDKTKNETALHFALKSHSIESFSCILEMHNEDLKFNENEESILYLTASYPSDGDFSKWEQVIKNGDVPLVNEIIKKFNDFKIKPNIKNLENVTLEKIPCAVLSYMVLSKGKSAYQAWRTKYKTKSPEEIFVESCKKFETSFHVNTFKLFYYFLDEKNQKYDICEFCNGNSATIIYKPCGHQIHCEFCAFMPFKCSTCNEDIKEKISAIDNNELNSFEIWDDLSKQVKGVTIKNMQDWYFFIKKTIRNLECPCCGINKWNVVLHCGHVLCKSCFEKFKKCIYFCKNGNPISIEVKGEF